MNKRIRRLGELAAVTVFGSIAWAHTPVYNDGVHINSDQPDFQVAPREYGWSQLDLGSQLNYRIGTHYLNVWTDREAIDEQEEELYRKATIKERKGDFAGALKIWMRGWNGGYGEPTLVRRRIEFFRAVKEKDSDGARKYLRAVAPTGKDGPLPEVADVDPLVRPFVAYEQISRIQDDQGAAARFSAFANYWPNSPLAEPALISVPRLLLLQGRRPANGDLESASSAIARLAKRFPKSRFSNDALGWRGRIEFLRGNKAAARKIYERQLAASPGNMAQVGKAIDSLLWCAGPRAKPAYATELFLDRYHFATNDQVKAVGARQIDQEMEKFSASDARAFRKRLLGDAALLSYYLDYRLDMTDPPSELMSLASSPAAKTPTAFRSHILARFAELGNRLRWNEAAVRYANESLELGGNRRDRALNEYVLGAIAMRQKRLATSLNHFDRVVRLYHETYLAPGARENLALLEEKMNRYDLALAQYRALGYKFDVAYLLDMRMTPGQIAETAAAESDPEVRRKDYFALGYRYLRENRWTLARGAFEKLTAKQRKDFTQKPETYFNEDDPRPDPLTTVHALSLLDRKVQNARNSSERAANRLAMAQYFYDRRSLLLYNAALWQGFRSIAIDFSWNSKIATAQDRAALRHHYWEHECLAHSLVLCRQIVKEAPNAPAKFQAAYLAACSAERLANFNGYWRWLDSKEDLYRESVHWMRFAKNSPNPVLAKKATKYAGVYEQERLNRNQEFKSYPPSKLYSPTG